MGGKIVTPNPFIPEELFRVNEDLEIHNIEGVIIIDNYYKNFEQVHDLLTSIHVPRWKWAPNGRNFKDYYDCRLTIANNFFSDTYYAEVRKLLQIIKEQFGETGALSLTSTDYDFNYLKHITLPTPNNQFYPHCDSPYSCIIYLDKVCSGGTALYEGLEGLENLEAGDLFFDVSNVKKRVVLAKPNRLVLFRATQMHGGYITDHSKYLDDWRINQVMFFEKGGEKWDMKQG